MGCDVCYTNHADADQDDMDTLLTLLGVAGVNYIMGVPGADDSCSRTRARRFTTRSTCGESSGLRPAPEFEAWLLSRGIFEGPTRAALPGGVTALPGFVASLPEQTTVSAERGK